MSHVLLAFRSIEPCRLKIGKPMDYTLHVYYYCYYYCLFICLVIYLFAWWVMASLSDASFLDIELEQWIPSSISRVVLWHLSLRADNEIVVERMRWLFFFVSLWKFAVTLFHLLHLLPVLIFGRSFLRLISSHRLINGVLFHSAVARYDPWGSLKIFIFFHSLIDCTYNRTVSYIVSHECIIAMSRMYCTANVYSYDSIVDSSKIHNFRV